MLRELLVDALSRDGLPYADWTLLVCTCLGIQVDTEDLVISFYDRKAANDRMLITATDDQAQAFIGCPWLLPHSVERYDTGVLRLVMYVPCPDAALLERCLSSESRCVRLWAAMRLLPFAQS